MTPSAPPHHALRVARAINVRNGWQEDIRASPRLCASPQDPSVGNSAVAILTGERVLDGSLIPIRHHYQEQ